MQFQKAGNDRNGAKHLKSVAHMQQLEVADDDPVQEMFRLPELHRLLDVEKSPFDSKKEEVWGEVRAYKWDKDKQLLEAVLEGGSPEGPACC